RMQRMFWFLERNTFPGKSILRMQGPLYRDSRLDYRQNVFRFAGINAFLQAAVTAAVEEINEESNAEPDEEANPCLQGQTEHECEAHDHAKNRKQGHQGDPKRSRSDGIRPPKHNYSQTNQDECKQRSDICEIG